MSTIAEHRFQASVISLMDKLRRSGATETCIKGATTGWNLKLKTNPYTASGDLAAMHVTVDGLIGHWARQRPDQNFGRGSEVPAEA